MQINFARREIACKIVYYGPGMSGKTTNLEVLHAKTPKQNKGELTCIATEGDRTLFFDFMPLNLGNIRGMNTKFQLYTVPGQVYYNSTRKLVLRGVDGVIFVADSAPDKMDENIESLRNLEDNLRDYGRDIDSITVILQYNKRDRSDALDVKIMNDKLNQHGYQWFEAVATDGTGVFDSLKSLAGQVIQKLELHASKGEAESRALTRTAAAPAAASASGTAAEPAVASARERAAAAPASAPRATSTLEKHRRGLVGADSSGPRHTGGARSNPTRRSPAGKVASKGRPSKGAATKAAPRPTRKGVEPRTTPSRRTRAVTQPVRKIHHHQSRSAWVTPLALLLLVGAAAGAAWMFLL